MIGGDDDALACMIFACMKALASLILAWLFDVRWEFGSEMLECLGATDEKQYQHSSSLTPLLLSRL
jgi:hypothetical protein